MKKTSILFTAIAIIFISVVILKAEQGKIRVVVEGEEEAIATKEAAKATPAAVVRSESKYTIDKLRKLAEKSNLESEVLDGIISKMIDLEEEQNRMKKEQDLKNFALLGAFLLLAVFVFARKKK